MLSSKLTGECAFIILTIFHLGTMPKSRAIPLLLFILLLSACNRPQSETQLRPLDVDPAATDPAQTPGTRPPVLTGLRPLNSEKLAEGWIQLFDGVSTYGLDVIDGDIRLTVGKDSQGCSALVREGTKGTIIHPMTGNKVTWDGKTSVFEAGGSQFEGHAHSSEGDVIPPTITGFEARPMHTTPLNESDWRPLSGASAEKCRVAWNDGILELTGGAGMIETVGEYGDFVLQLEYLTEEGEDGKGVNSGVFFRCIPGEVMNGYECQIYNNPPAEDYEKFIGTDTGGLFRRYVGRNVGARDGVWNHVTVIARGPGIATWVNGVQTAQWTDTRNEDENPRKGLRLKAGTIQLQGHDPQTKIRFRNMRIQSLEKDTITQ